MVKTKRLDAHDLIKILEEQSTPENLKPYKERVLEKSKELMADDLELECLCLLNEVYFTLVSSFPVSEEFYLYHKELSDLTTIHQNEDDLEDESNLIFVDGYHVDEDGNESETGLDYEALSYPKNMRHRYYAKKGAN